MKRILHCVRLCGLLLMVAVMTTSCIFGSRLEVSVAEGEDGRTISIATSATGSICTQEIDSAAYFCGYFLADSEELFPSFVSFTDLELALFLILLDPVVLQLPLEAHNFAGTFLHQESGQLGSLAITEGLASVRADATQTIRAEAGKQLVIIDLPDDALHSGSFTYNFNFRVPEDTSSLEIKALYTGRVEVNGATFYPPPLPCTTDMGALPTISIPMSAGGLVTLPTDDIQGCDHALYSLNGSVPANNVFIPLLHD